jgi:hypothetical protein
MLHRLFSVVVLLLLGVVPGAAQPASGTPDVSATSEVRATAGRIALGTPVGIALRDGQRMTGVLLDVGERGVMVQPAPSEEPVLIDYGRIEAVTARTTWYPSVAPTTMRYGAGFALVIAAIVAVGWRLRNRRL